MRNPFRRHHLPSALDEAYVTQAADVSGAGGARLPIGIVYKANIGDEKTRAMALLTAIVVASGPRHAHELLLAWTKGGELAGMIQAKAYYLEVIHRHVVTRPEPLVSGVY